MRLQEGSDSRRTERPIQVEVVGGEAVDVRIVARALEREGRRASVFLVAPDDAPAGGLTALADVVVLRGRTDVAAIRSAAGARARARIVLVSPDVRPAGVRSALEAGAHGIVAADGWAHAIGPAVAGVLAGLMCLPLAARDLLRPPPALSRRERQVLALLAEGLSNAEMAERLFLSESTVKSHVTSAFRRLGVHSRREAVAVLFTGEPLRRSVLDAHRGGARL